MKIESGMASFYNASSSRLQSVNNVSQSSKVSQVSDANGVAANSSNSASQYLSSHGGVVQTRVSPENSYQKAMLSDPRANIEKMAGKLMSKLPNILKDMQNLTADNAANTASDNTSNKVVITEANAGAGSTQGSSAQGTSGTNAAASGAMMDFSL